MPRINKENALKISGYVENLISGYVDGLEEEIDKIIYNAFDLTKEEIVKIESYIA
jgi:hypothetical protein